MGVVVVSTVSPQRERVTGASRRVVYRLDLQARTAPGLLPLTVSAAYRDAEGNERSTASCQVSLSIDQHSKTPLDVKYGTIVAEAWLAMVARRAMGLNHMEDYREAGSWLRQQSTDFNRYWPHLPDSGALVNQMRALCRSSVQPMQESSRKEITLSRYQHLKGVSDQRVAASEA